MESLLIIIRLYYRTLSVLSPTLAGNEAFKMFQKVRKKEVRKREMIFFEKAKSFKIDHYPEEIHAYELGNPEGEIVIMLHGWDSNAGSLSKIAFEMADNGYRVFLMNLPGHAYAKAKSSNIFIAKNAFKAFLNHINPKTPPICITHSFGSAMLTYGLSETDIQVSKIVFLTSPNKIQDIFDDFKSLIGLGNKAFRVLCEKATTILGEDLKQLEIAEKLAKVRFDDLLIIHDKNDKIIPFSNSEEINKKHQNSTLKSFENIGHYRMLWNDDVLSEIMNFITSNKKNTSNNTNRLKESSPALQH